jgi:hypothetical protein
MTEPPQKYVVVVEMAKPGVKLDKLEEVTDPPQGPPVIGGMYVFRYVTAILGEKLRVTIEKAE